MTSGPVPFEVFRPGIYLHGTKAVLVPGEVLEPWRASNFEDGRISNHIYITETLDAAAWGAELAAGDGPGHIYIVEPIGEIEDDPNLTDKRFPGNPTHSYRALPRSDPRHARWACRSAASRREHDHRLRSWGDLPHRSASVRRITT